MSAKTKPPTSSGKNTKPLSQSSEKSSAKSPTRSPAKSPTETPQQSLSPIIPNDDQNLALMFEFYARIVKLIILKKDDTDG